MRLSGGHRRGSYGKEARKEYGVLRVSVIPRTRKTNTTSIHLIIPQERLLIYKQRTNREL